MSTILEQSEGPETNQMREMLDQLKRESEAAHKSYDEEIMVLIENFEDLVE